MKAVACLLVLTIASAPTVSAARSRLKGYAEVNQLLRQRLLAPGSGFELGRYLDEQYADAGANLLDLLGTYKGNDLGSRFKNGSANSANMLLWHFLLASLARDVANECSGGGRLELEPQFKAAVLNGCQWPAPASRAIDALERFWILVIGYDAPRSEFEEWRKFIQDSTFTSSEDAVFTMLLTAISNPRFLLEN